MSFYVTTPIYYVNAAPHLGHAYSTIGADILARHRRQDGEEVFFLTGTDEHGEPVAEAAMEQGVTPQQLADQNSQRFRELMPKLNISNDFFIRTSDAEHADKVREIMQRVYDNGYVYSGTYEGWYCPRCADFKTETEIAEGNKCPIHKIELEWKTEENYFFKLSAFQEKLEKLYAEKQDFVEPSHRYNEARSFIEQGLKDISLSRANLTWGVKVPWDESQVFYVWFDALLNYITALSYAKPGEDLTEKFWPAQHHIIGKDILKFHAVFWPALLMAADYELPEHIFIHGFLLMDGEKMSKSLGNVLDPVEIVDTFGADALRFYCFREVSFGKDGSVSAAGFETRYETELANDYGNLVSRSIAMIVKYRDGVVPSVDPATVDVGAEMPDLNKFRELLKRAQLTDALELVWESVRRLNRYVEEREPWKQAKDPELAGELDITLYGLAEGIRTISILLHAYLPQSTEQVLAALGQSDVTLEAAHFGEFGGGVTVEKIPPLFPKLER